MLEKLSTPHTPSRTQAVAFLVVALTIAGALAVWELFINFGTLVLLADGPMTAIVNNDTIECPTPPCVVKLKPKEYTVTFKRNGYFDTTQKISLHRFEQNPITAQFSIIPTLKKYTDHTLPTSFPLSSLLTAPTTLPNFPKNAIKAVFSPSAQSALLTIDDKLEFYSAKTGTLTALTISPNTPYTWAAGSIIFMGLDASNTQTLYRYGVTQSTPLVRFERPLVKPQLAADATGNFVIVSDLDTERVHYVVDATTLSKTRIQLNTTAELVGFADAYALFEEKTTLNETRLNAVALTRDAQGAAKPAIVLPKALGGTATLSDDQHLLYISEEKTDIQGDAAQTSIEDVISQISEISTPTGDVSDASSSDLLENIDRETRYTVYLTELDLTTQKTKTLVTIPLTETQKITDMARIEKTVFIRIGKEIFQIVK